MPNLFTYGTLLFSEIIEALTERSFAFEELTLRDYERRALIGRRYPGLIESPGASVTGKLWFGLDEKSMQIIDRFEDIEYERRSIALTSDSRGVVEARVYVLTPEKESILAPDDWSPQQFERTHLEQYRQMCRQFRVGALKKGIGL